MPRPLALLHDAAGILGVVAAIQNVRIDADLDVRFAMHAERAAGDEHEDQQRPAHLCGFSGPSACAPPEGAAPHRQTGTTRTFPPVDARVFLAEWMTAQAVRSTRTDRGGANPAKDIDAMGDRLKMLDVNARRHATEMVQREPCRNRAAGDFIGGAMG